KNDGRSDDGSDDRKIVTTTLYEHIFEVWDGNNNINARQQQREHGNNSKTSDSCTPTARADREGKSVDGFVSRPSPTCTGRLSSRSTGPYQVHGTIRPNKRRPLADSGVIIRRKESFSVVFCVL
ncbi:unnamed protein product, partial [Ectocarpus sp. 13 AM-2016]